ncbi:MAG TPA: PP2C family protein-serine/threonine phosphatase [Spirochaetota bacterium]|nr:PP2C family protein-serine/threonine phosphatase [Spirochaetota bacterium]
MHVRDLFSRLIEIFHIITGKEKLSSETRRKRLMAACFYSIAIPITSILGFHHYLNNEVIIGYVNIGVAAGLIGAFIFSRFIKRGISVDTFNAMLFFMLFAYTLYRGRCMEYASIWGLMYPPGVFLLAGKNKGLFWSILLFVYAVPVMVLPESVIGQCGYNDQYTLRYLITYSILVFFSYSNEMSRLEFYNSLEDEKEKVEHQNKELQDVIKKLEDYQEEFNDSMRMAIRVQRNILPKSVPESPEWETAVYYQPMAGVSGDFYDFYEQDGRYIGMGIFDVSGHGIASGLITTIAKSNIFRQYIADTSVSLSSVMENINAVLCRELMRDTNFVTGILLRFDGDMVRCVSAGHPPLLLRKSIETVKVPDRENGQVIGALLGVFDENVSYPEYSFTVSRGDYILLYTDYLVESQCDVTEQYGEKRIIQSFTAAASNNTKSADEVLKAVLGDFNSFNYNSERPRDDLTVIVLKRKV